MIKAFLIIWNLDPSGAGAVSVQPMPSLAECYRTAAYVSTLRVACEPETRIAYVARTLGDNRCTERGDTFICEGKK